jgi:hypothetical protein
MTKKRYWIGVACKDRLMIGVKGGFAQLQQGRMIRLQKMSEGDWLLLTLPCLCLTNQKADQRLPTFGSTINPQAYAFDLGTVCLPYRMDGDFALCEEAPVLPLPARWSFLGDKKRWDDPFRLGQLEIGDEDFELLVEELGQDVDLIKH